MLKGISNRIINWQCQQKLGLKIIKRINPVVHFLNLKKMHLKKKIILTNRQAPNFVNILVVAKFNTNLI